MIREDPLGDKSIQLGVQSVEYARLLKSDQYEISLVNQFVRSATAVGASIAEASEAESKADMHHKFGIALKEARETKYWLRIFQKTTTTAQEKHDDITLLTKEITFMLIASRKTLKESLKQTKSVQ